VRRALLVVAVTAAIVAVPATVASAHPLGNFTINIYGGIALTPGEVRIDYVVDMAEIPTFQTLPDIDVDGDGVMSDAERSAWATRTAPELMRNLSVAVGGDPVVLREASSAMRFRPGQGGLRTLRLEATFVGTVPSSGELTYRDRNFSDRIGWREVTAAGADGNALGSSSVPARSVSDALLSYPQDLLASPLHVTEATVWFHPGASAPLVEANPSATGLRTGVTGGGFAGLVDVSGPVMLLALLLALAFGALHALGPGHGKTLMAAYLVGAGGRARQAVALGGAVAVMHTASVLGLGVVVLSATRLFPAERVYPWLGLASGLVALGLGAALLAARLAAWSGSPARLDVDDLHDHENGQRHGHPHGHAHAQPEGPVLSRKGLSALAFAGGILPSPTALVVLLATVAFHRVAYGLALIASFSMGLAAALIVVGILALRARDLIARRMSSRAGRLVPVLSASTIALLGLVLTVRGAAQV
jgi:nickel/cobalt exporter